MKRSVYFCLVFCALFHNVPESIQFEMDNIGRVVRGHLGTLYDLRNKLATPSPSSSSSVSLPSTSSADHSARKESRGYSFHYSSSDISHPLYSPSYASQDFHSRSGKVSDVPSASKWKNSETSWDKFSKLSYKTANHAKDHFVANSFNVHQKDSTAGLNETATILLPTSSTTTSTTSSTTSSSTTTSTPRSTGVDLTPIKALSQGLNSAMTTVLTQKLMSLMDQEVPRGVLNPLKHLVSSGNRMIEFWDKRANARDGKTPGIVEILGYGIDQLKQFRDGQAIKATDPVANLTSASKTLIQGMITVKKLTNRVLGYDTDDNAIESRAGYGDGGYGHGGGGGYGHHVSYGNSGLGGLDPFSLLAALAFGAFLLQLLLTLLNTSARSLDVVDINTPLMMSDYHVPNFMTKMDKIFGTPTTRTKRSSEGSENMFYSIVDKLDGVYKTYRQISEKPVCARLYICRLAVQNASGDEDSVLSQLYVYGLSHLAKETTATEFARSIQTRVANGEDVDCDKIVTDCDVVNQL